MIAVTGVESTTAALNTLPKKMAKRAVRKSVNAGGGVFLKAARRNAPRANGTFRRSLIVKVKNYQAGSVAIIGQNRNAKGSAKIKRSGGISGRGDVVPSHFIENPIKPHRLAPKTKTLLRFDAGNGVVFARSVMHPGTRGQFPIRRAAQSSEREAVSVLTTKLAVETRSEITASGFTL